MRERREKWMETQGEAPYALSPWPGWGAHSIEMFRAEGGGGEFGFISPTSSPPTLQSKFPNAGREMGWVWGEEQLAGPLPISSGQCACSINPCSELGGLNLRLLKNSMTQSLEKGMISHFSSLICLNAWCWGFFFNYLNRPKLIYDKLCLCYRCWDKCIQISREIKWIQK